MAEPKTVELISPDGKKTWSSTDAVEITNLRARGWRNKPAAEAEPDGIAAAVPSETAAPEPPANKLAPTKPSK